MSYGRSPYYIIGTEGRNGDVIQFIEPAGSVERGEFPYPIAGDEASIINVPKEAMAQFIAHLTSRGTSTLQAWIDAGAALNSDYNNFYKNHPDKTIRAEETKYNLWLQTCVTVTRDGKVI